MLWRKVYMLVLCLSLIDDEYDRMNFERIYTKYADDVFKRICKLVKNKQDAEDVMQETWLTIAENIEFYRAKEDDSIRAYILRIARNQSITLYHAKQKEEQLRCDIDSVDLTDSYDYENILFNVCDKIDVSTISKCIDCLDEIYSDVLNYFYLHNHTVKEISKILKLKEVTVRARLTRGRIKLLQILEGRNLNDR